MLVKTVACSTYIESMQNNFAISHTCSIIFSLWLIQNNSNPLARCKHGRPHISHSSNQSFTNNLHSHSCFRVWPRHFVLDYRYSSKYFSPWKKKVSCHQRGLFWNEICYISCFSHSFPRWPLKCIQLFVWLWHFSDITPWSFQGWKLLELEPRRDNWKWVLLENNGLVRSHNPIMAPGFNMRKVWNKTLLTEKSVW